MAVTLTARRVAEAIRLIADPGADLAEPQAAQMDRLLAVATLMVQKYAPLAPDAIHNEAAVRVCGYLYDVPPGSARRMQSPLWDSGAVAVLGPYRVRRAFRLEDAMGSRPPTVIQVLRDNQAVGDSFLAIGGVGVMVLSGHSGGTWTLQIQDPNGVWISARVFWNADDQRTFDSQNHLYYRLNGGTVGAQAWYVFGGAE